jgi:DNA-binding CsgD family transcriptional regulator
VTAKPEPGQSLTAREREIARLAADGWNDIRIARTLFLSSGTVRGYVKNIRVKTGTHSRAEIVQWVKAQQAATAAGEAVSRGRSD